jgi:hypothetical protein
VVGTIIMISKIKSRKSKWVKMKQRV